MVTSQKPTIGTNAAGASLRLNGPKHHPAGLGRCLHTDGGCHLGKRLGIGNILGVAARSVIRLQTFRLVIAQRER